MDEKAKVFPANCPICGVPTNYTYRIDNGIKKSEWYRCQNGIIFQKDLPSKDKYDEDYVKAFDDLKNYNLNCVHLIKTYIRLIEELAYGVKFLDVGFNKPHTMDFLKQRGWITQGIEINPKYKNRDDVIIADYENYEGYMDQYNLIWMAYVFETFKDPIKVLKKTRELMHRDSVLFIATPDIDFLNQTGGPHFPHWRQDENYVLWSKAALVKELERLGYNIVMVRKNYSLRYVGWYDTHILCQKEC